MTYVYHRVPSNMQASILYPLNQLKDHHPELYRIYMKKYEGRQFVMTTPIPILNCLWSDVLHCSPVHPEKIRDGLLSVGGKWRLTHWFMIDIKQHDFNATNTVYYFSGMTPKDRRFELFEFERLSKMRDLPAETLAYYHRTFDEDKHPLLFAHVPHVLYQGQINIQDVDVIAI